MKNMVLIGMPGSGKTTLGRYLAEMLGWDFLDADAEIVKDSGQTIPQLFAQSEDIFRAAECRTVARLSQLQGKVLAMGGGVVVRPENIRNLKKQGLIIYIDRSPAEIMSDVQTEGRPLLQRGRQQILLLYAARKKLYQQAADVTLPNHGSLKEALQSLLQLVKEQEGKV